MQPVEFIVAAAVDDVILQHHFSPVVLFQVAALDQIAGNAHHIAVGSIEGTVLVANLKRAFYHVQQRGRIALRRVVKGKISLHPVGK